MSPNTSLCVTSETSLSKENTSLVHLVLPIGITVMSSLIYPLCINVITFPIAVQPTVAITTPEIPIHSKPFEATCRASLESRVAVYLLQYLRVDWVGPDGQIIGSQRDEMSSVGDPQITSNAVSRSLVFETLNMTDGGNYTCEAKLILPDSTGSFNTTGEYHLGVLSKIFVINLDVTYVSFFYNRHDSFSTKVWPSCSLFQVV